MNGRRFIKSFFKRNASTGLTLLSLAGLVGTVILAIRAKGKVDEDMAAAEVQKGELTKLETAVVAAPHYIPVIFMMIGTGACIISSNVVSKKQIRDCMAAYNLLQSSIIAYRKRIGGDISVIDADIARQQIEMDPDKPELEDFDENVVTFYEPYTRTYFNATEEFVKDAYSNTNRNLAHRKYTSLGEFIDALDIDVSDSLPEILGWDESVMIMDWDKRWVDIGWERTTLDDGMEVRIITYDPVPTLDETLFPMCREAIIFD